METVDFYSFFPYTWVIHLIRALISFNIIHTALSDKYNSLVTFLSITLTGMAFSYLSLIDYINSGMDALVSFLYYVVQFAVVSVVCKGKLFSKLFAVVFSLIAYMCSAAIYQLLYSLVSGKVGVVAVLQTTMKLNEFMASAAIIYASSFLFTAIVKVIKNKTDRALLYKNKFIYFMLFPLTHVITMSACFSSKELPRNSAGAYIVSDYIILIISSVCILIDFFLVFLIDYIEKIETENIENEKELIKNTLDFQQTVMLKKEKEEFRKIKHDFANLISTARGFIEIGKPEKALAMLQSTDDSLVGLAGFSVCSNETVNTIIFIKQQQAKSSDIKLLTEINENHKILIDDFDLCRLLNNIIDNAVNAVSETDGERVCKVEMDIAEKEIRIKSENKYNSEKKAVGKKSREHGNGLKIIREIVNKYSGSYNAYQSGDLWYAEITIKNTGRPKIN